MSISEPRKRKLIFAFAATDDNLNSTRNQRVIALAGRYQVALLHQGLIPDTIRKRVYESWRIRGGAFSYLLGIPLIAYLRFFKGYRVLHTQNCIYAIVWGFLAQLLFGMRWIYDLWDHPSLEFSLSSSATARIKGILFRIVIRRMIASADLVIIAMHNGIREFLPRPGKRTRIIKITNGTNPVDPTILPSRTNSGPFPAIGDTLNFCYSGWVTLERGFSLLIGCLRTLDDRCRILVTAFGKTNTATLRAIAEHNRSSPHLIHYLGEIPHRESLARIAASDACLCILDQAIINYRFAYPIKVLEYIAMGKQIIASDTPGIREILGGSPALLIENDVASLAEAFAKIIRMKAAGILEEAGKRIGKLATRYQWDDINRRILAGVDEIFPPG